MAHSPRPGGWAPQAIAKSLGNVSYAQAEEFCADVARRAALAPAGRSMAAIVEARLQQWQLRARASGICAHRDSALDCPHD